MSDLGKVVQKLTETNLRLETLEKQNIESGTAASIIAQSLPEVLSDRNIAKNRESFDRKEGITGTDDDVRDNTKKLGKKIDKLNMKSKKDGDPNFIGPPTAPSNTGAGEEDEKDRQTRKTNRDKDDADDLAAAQKLADLKSQIRDAEANTVAEQRAKELEDLQAHYTNLILLAEENDINTDELKKSRDEAILALNQSFLDEDLAAKKAAADEDAAIVQAGLDIKKQSLQTLSELFGQETALGKAALIAKQAILLQELIVNVKSTLSNAKTAVTNSTLKGVEATADSAAGLAKTSAAVPFPANIPLIIGYIAQAVGIIGAIKSAVGATKGVASSIGAGGGGSTAGITAPSAPAISAANIDLGVSPETQVQNNAVQTYVVSGDITSSQEAEAKLNNRRQISG